MASRKSKKIWIWIGSLVLLVIVVIGVGAARLVRTTNIDPNRIAKVQRGDVLRLVLGHGMALVAAGGAAGLATGFAISRLLAKFLYGLPAGDPVTFGAVAAGLAAVAFIANWVPARRALRVDPMVALRYD